MWLVKSIPQVRNMTLLLTDNFTLQKTMKGGSWTRFYLLLSLFVLYILLGKFYLDDFGGIIYEVPKQIISVKNFLKKENPSFSVNERE